MSGMNYNYGTMMGMGTPYPYGYQMQAAPGSAKYPEGVIPSYPTTPGTTGGNTVQGFPFAPGTVSAPNIPATPTAPNLPFPPVGTSPAAGGACPPQVNSGGVITPQGTVLPASVLTGQQSYIENILRLNLGKIGTFYMTYENNCEWNAKVFRGVVEAAGRDHIIISDPNTGMRTILLMVNLDYATFDEPLTYLYPGVIGNQPTRKQQSS